jgi:glycosyltransferase involved in cell wall biosynthesis
MFTPDIGGIETTSMRLLPELQARGHQIIALASHSHLDLPEESTYQNIPVYRFPILNAIAKRNLSLQREIQAKVANLKRSFQPDLVQLCIGPPVIALFHLKTIESFPCPTLLSIHANLSGYGAGPNTFLGNLFRNVDWLTSDSQATFKSIHQIYPEAAQKSTVIHNGFQFSSTKIEALNFEIPHIVCIGRLAREKGFDLIINSFEKISQYFRKAHLTIAGEGPARHALEHQVKETGLDDRVQFPGRIAHEEILSLLNSATIVVIPSRCQESFPMVAIEAACLARPIIAARVGGIPESVTHKETGLLFEKENQTDLTKAIHYLIKHPDVAIRMGEAGFLRAKDNFGWSHYVDEYEKLYTMLAS